jgi:transposase
MPPRLSVTVGTAIDRDIIACNRRLTPQEVSTLAINYRCTETTIYRHQQRIQAGRPLQARTGGQQRVITPQIDTAILQLLNTFLWFYLNEIAEFLLEVFNISVSLSTISTALARIKITRKKLRVKAAQRNKELCTA